MTEKDAIALGTNEYFDQLSYQSALGVTEEYELYTLSRCELFAVNLLNKLCSDKVRSILFLKVNSNLKLYSLKQLKMLELAIGKTSAIMQSARSGACLTIFFTVPIIILQHFLEDEVLLSNLLADLAVSLIKVGVSSIAAAVAVGTTTTIAAAPLAVALFIGLAIAYSLDKLDEYFSITEKLGLILREIEDATIGEISRKGWELEKTLRWQITNDITPSKGTFYP